MIRHSCLAAAFAALLPTPARADYAPPPEHYRPYDDCTDDRPCVAEAAPLPRSTIRIHTGPALRVADEDPRAGLFAAIDVGARAAGARLSGTFIGTGGEGGFSLYSGEIWVDFGDRAVLHPILAAGAGLARVEPRDGTGDSQSLGVGVLRGGLQYRLPVDGVDARAGLDLAANVRAFGGASAAPTAWLIAAATVGVGF